MTEIAILTVPYEKAILCLKERDRQLVYAAKLKNGSDLMSVSTKHLIVVGCFFLKIG